MAQAPALIVMAGGIGSRYGGLKQVDPIGPNGEIVIDYAVFDALRAGFEQVVFVIRRELEATFREKVGRNIEPRADVRYVYQDLENLPPGWTVPPERKKPWGTAHAVLSCKGVVERPFAVINADDFYGPAAFTALAGYLREARDPEGGPYDYCMVGYVLGNTLSEHGAVARGICDVTPDGYLAGVQERTRIHAVDGVIQYTENGQDWTALPPDSLVSLNTWGFTPSLFAELEARFPVFLEGHRQSLNTAEFFLPSVVNQLLSEGLVRVKVLPVQEKWYGVTYPEDRPQVQQAIRQMVARGMYPGRLWQAPLHG